MRDPQTCIRGAGVPLGRPKARPAAFRFTRASVVRRGIISRSISAARPNTVAVIRLWIEPSSCYLAMCTLTRCVIQYSSISRTCRVERAMRLISAKGSVNFRASEMRGRWCAGGIQVTPPRSFSSYGQTVFDGCAGVAQA